MSRFSEATDLARKTAEMASHDIGIRETGKNSGKRIKQYLATVGLKQDGHPYCIAAVCTWIKEAAAAGGVRQELLFSPSCIRFLAYAVKTNHAFLPVELTPGMLPCVFIIDHGKGKGHAGLVIEHPRHRRLAHLGLGGDLGEACRHGETVTHRQSLARIAARSSICCKVLLASR